MIARRLQQPRKRLDPNAVYARPMRPITSAPGPIVEVTDKGYSRAYNPGSSIHAVRRVAISLPTVPGYWPDEAEAE